VNRNERRGLKVPSPRTHLLKDDQTLEPVIPAIDTVDDVKALLGNVPQFASLPIKQLKVLLEISHDILSEQSRSDQQIALDVGCNRETVHNARSNPRFAACLGILVIGIARGRSDLYLRWTEDSAKKGNSSSLKLLWQLTGLYVERRANLNVNVDQQLQQAPQTFGDAYTQFLIALGTAGYTAERITSDFNDLRAKGAFG